MKKWTKKKSKERYSAKNKTFTHTQTNIFVWKIYENEINIHESKNKNKIKNEKRNIIKYTVNSKLADHPSKLLSHSTSYTSCVQKSNWTIYLYIVWSAILIFVPIPAPISSFSCMCEPCKEPLHWISSKKQKEIFQTHNLFVHKPYALVH